MKSVKSNQRGFSFLIFFYLVSTLIVIVAFVAKIAPAYMHNADIKHILKTIANDPAMKSATTGEIKQSYNKRASIEGISEIVADDLDINKEDEGLSLSANYFVKIPLIANITLLLEFNASSS